LRSLIDLIGIVAIGRENETKGKPSRAKSLSKSGDARTDSGLDIETQALSSSGRGRSFFLTSLFIELIDCISVGVDRMQRNFEPIRKQVEAWQRSELADVTAKVVIYKAFVEGRLGCVLQLVESAAPTGSRAVISNDLRWIRAQEKPGKVRLKASHPYLGTQQVEIAVAGSPEEAV
jgi:hypothetical protein